MRGVCPPSPSSVCLYGRGGYVHVCVWWVRVREKEREREGERERERVHTCVCVRERVCVRVFVREVCPPSPSSVCLYGRGGYVHVCGSVCGRDVGGWGRDRRKQKGCLYYCQKKTKPKNLMSVGRRRPLLHYWYKVPVLHTIKYRLMSVW